MPRSDDDFTADEPEERRPGRAPRRRDRDDDDDRPSRRRRRDYDDPPRSSGMATASMVLGLLSLMFCVFTGIPGLILGVIALLSIKNSNGQLTGAGMAWTGIVLGLFNLAVPAALYFPISRQVEQNANQMKSQNNLKQTGLALHNYHDTRGELPPAYIATADGKPGLSWRVAILPYIEQDSLYRQFNLDEPWDSPTNMALLSKMPATYRSPNDPPGTTDTPYRVFVGREAAFPKEPRSLTGRRTTPLERARRLTDISDGLSNTIFVVEASTKVPWTKPDEFDFSMTGPVPELGYVSPDYFLVLLGDGSVRRIEKKRISQETLRKLINPADGQMMGSDW